MRRPQLRAGRLCALVHTRDEDRLDGADAGDYPSLPHAKVAELADAPDSGSGGVTPVGVQVPSFAPPDLALCPPECPPTRALLGVTASSAACAARSSPLT